MKNHSSLYSILLLLSIPVFFSCSKDESDNFDLETGSFKGKLQKIILTNTKDSIFMEFKYDSYGRISNYFVRGTESDDFQSWGFSRNSSGQVTMMTYNEDHYSDLTKYEISADGKYISATESDGSKDIYTYTGNRITKIAHFYKNAAIYTSILKWDSRGNLVSKEVIHPDAKYKWEGTYDNKKNPVESLEFPVFENWNTNNILTNIDEELSATYNYTYDKSGRPATASVMSIYSDGDSYSYYLIYVYN
jgi:hypothetical protein